MLLIAFWVAIVALGVIAFYQFGPLIQATATVLAAFVSAAALIFGGILTHYLSEIRAQRLADQTRRQEQYRQILEKLSDLIRTNKASDEFMTAHLHTCVVSSPEVIDSSALLIRNAATNVSAQNLNALLMAMRKDLGLSTTPVDVMILFPCLSG
jgi:hypothetical protein